LLPNFTAGAGSLFAAGFLFGFVRNAGYEACGRLGALAAAKVIQHIGARPQVSLKELARQNGLPVQSEVFSARHGRLHPAIHVFLLHLKSMDS
jgi:hypothetical protein